MRGIWWNRDNDQAQGDQRLIWDSGHYLPLLDHTAIWRVSFGFQAAYHAVAWHSPNTGNFDSGAFSFGTHPYPAADGTTSWSNDGSVTEGTSATPTYGSGRVHFHEIAGGGAAYDYLATPGPGALGLEVSKRRWLLQIRRARALGGGLFEYRYRPDVIGNPAFEIVHTSSLDPTPNAGVNPAFYFGCSDWALETPFCVQRALQLYTTYLSDADAETEAMNDKINAAQTSAGQTYLHYINQDPTFADIGDKKPSGTLHTPRWANTNRTADFVLDQRNSRKYFPIPRLRR